MVKGYRNKTVGVSRFARLAVCAVGGWRLARLRGWRLAHLRGWQFARLAVCAVGSLRG